MRFNLLYIFCLFGVIINAQQRNIPFEKAFFPGQKDGLKEAQKSIKQGDYIYNEVIQYCLKAKTHQNCRKLGNSVWVFALEHYEKAQRFNPNNSNLNYKLGNCYLYSQNKSKGFKSFKKAYQLNPAISNEIHLKIGRCYHLNSDFENAISEYELYRKVLNTKDDQDEILELGRLISQCKFGKKLMEKPERVWIDNLGSEVNSRFPDYSPMINADESVIIFTSRRGSGIGDEKDVEDMGFMEDIFVSYKDIDDNWTMATGLDENINTKSHDATSGISNDGLTIFIYYGHKGMGDIYMSKKIDGIWTKARSIGKKINGKDSHETSACLSFDGKKLYFSSNRGGGFGDHDIWVCNWDNERDEWGEPNNLGGIVNTQFDERSIFMHPDGRTMYFSSDGHPGMGGYDIYYSTMNDDEVWTKPINIGYPISTPDHDVQFVMSSSGKHGYYASLRDDGKGEKDIYMITFLGAKKIPILNGEDNLLASVVAPIKEDMVQPKVEVRMKNLTIFKGKVLDSETNDPVKSKIELIDNLNSSIVSEFNNDGETGKFILSLPAGKNYGIAVNADGYLFHSENFDIPKSAGFREYEKIIYLKKIKKNVSIVLRNIFFDLDKYTLKPESKIELDRLIALLTDNPDIRIEISGHTDSRGSSSYNQDLSEDRAKEVVDYLISVGGFPKGRFEYKGYGEKSPLILKEDIAKLKVESDREEAHSLNRRTEFKIID